MGSGTRIWAGGVILWKFDTFRNNAQWISTFDDFRVICCSWRMLSLLTTKEHLEKEQRVVWGWFICQSGACTGQVGPVWGGWQWAGRARPFLPCQPGLGRRCQPGKTGVDILAASVFLFLWIHHQSQFTIAAAAWRPSSNWHNSSTVNCVKGKFHRCLISIKSDPCNSIPWV